MSKNIENESSFVKKVVKKEGRLSNGYYPMGTTHVSMINPITGEMFDRPIGTPPVANFQPLPHAQRIVTEDEKKEAKEYLQKARADLQEKLQEEARKKIREEERKRALENLKRVKAEKLEKEQAPAEKLEKEQVPDGVSNNNNIIEPHCSDLNAIELEEVDDKPKNNEVNEYLINESKEDNKKSFSAKYGIKKQPSDSKMRQLGDSWEETIKCSDVLKCYVL